MCGSQRREEFPRWRLEHRRALRKDREPINVRFETEVIVSVQFPMI